MTREEAIWWVNHLFEIRKEEYFNKGMMKDAKEVEEAERIAIEALNDIAKWRTWSHTYDNACMDGEMGDLISRADAIEAVRLETGMRGLLGRGDILDILYSLPSAENEWIPCSERLPEVGEICLLTVHEYGWNCKEYMRVIIGEYSDNYANHILAWMPLPTPYKGGEKSEE